MIRCSQLYKYEYEKEFKDLYNIDFNFFLPFLVS